MPLSLTDSSAPLGMKAPAHPWPNTLLYAFPPVNMILPVAETVHLQGLSLILVPPQGPAKLWFAEIISLLAACLPFERANLIARGLPLNVVATIQNARASSRLICLEVAGV